MHRSKPIETTDWPGRGRAGAIDFAASASWPFHEPLGWFAGLRRCCVCLDLWHGLEFGLEMTRKTEGQGDDSQGRIRKPAGGKNRAAGDK